MQVVWHTWQSVSPHALVVDERKSHECQEANDVGNVEHLQQYSKRLIPEHSVHRHPCCQNNAVVNQSLSRDYSLPSN